MIYTTAVAYKFAIYLHKNEHLNDYRIEKNQARKIFYENFRAEQGVNLNFGTVFFHSLSLLKKQPNLSIMVFKQIKLQNLQNKEADIDLSFNMKRVKSPKKIVSHIFSLSKRPKVSQDTLSGRECELCQIKFETLEKLREHFNQEEHKFLEEFNKSLMGTKTQSELQFSIDDSPSLNNIILRKDTPKTLQLKIKNTTKFGITITKIQTDQKINQVQFNPTCPCNFPSMTIINFQLTVLCKIEGVVYYPILLATESNQQKKQYAIELVFHTHGEFFDDLHPLEPYLRPSKPVIKDLIEEVDSGERPNIFPKKKMKVPLRPYLLPVDMSIVLDARLNSFGGMSENQRQQLNNIKKTLPPQKGYSLTPQNYTKLLDLLLYIEEHQMMKDIRDYDQHDQVLKKVGGLFELEVPGLAEHRPSVIIADSIKVRESVNGKILYEGFVHKVNEASVLLHFSQKFASSFIKGKKFYVQFSFNRYPLRVEHQAVDLARVANIPHLLFPQKIHTGPLEPKTLNWFNKDIGNNPGQQQAIRAVLGKTAMPYPYLIFGPPGTGKTMTIVEAVKQVHRLTNEKILICTPSNNAANEVTRRLIMSIPTTDLFRFIAPSFPYHLIPEGIKKYINFPGGQYYQPTIEEFTQYRIVITTLTSAAKLVNSGLPLKHFSYVFVDEAGQATESETLIAIAGILTGGPNSGVLNGQIVLAGDPKQLGPIIHSNLAKDYGFGTSMLERLMDTCEPYKKNNDHYNPNALTKLIKNYRSHGTIIKTSNELFYENELQISGDHLINIGLNWEHLPNKQFPMIFHSVLGEDQKESTSPSFFNIQEVQIVMSYLEKLLGNRLQGMSIREEHIGILTPYKKQVEKIRKACEKQKYNERLMIGTVEQFQGQEKLIVILSTVRSKQKMLKFDQKFHLGFLNNPKRFNVAITRAKALLIVIGNPNVLQLDKHWRSLIQYCSENNAAVGDSFQLFHNEYKETQVEAEKSLIVEPEPEEGPSFSRGVQ